MKIKMDTSGNKCETLGLKEIVQNAMASFIITVPGLIQYCLYGVVFYAISYICLFTFIFAFVSHFRISLKLLSPLMAISFYNAVLMVSFGRIFGQFDYLAVINASFHEILVFLRVNIGKGLFLLGATLLFISYLYCFVFTQIGLKWIKSPNQLKRKILLPFIFIALLPFLFSKQQEILASYPFACLSDFIIAYKFKEKASTYPAKFKCDSHGNSKTATEFPAMVLVIGESARFDAFGFNANGASTGHSPEMDSFVKTHPNNSIIFRNYLSVGQSTVPTVLTMLNPIGTDDIMHCFEKPNLLCVISEAGCPTIVARGQECGFVNEYLGVAERICDFRDLADKEMLPLLKDELNSPSGKILVLHAKGSHVNYYGEGTENYIRSIRATDLFLEELFEIIIKSKSPACAWYTSDHGENKDFIHGSGNITLSELEVPSIIVANDTFISLFHREWNNMDVRKAFILTHNNLPHTIMGVFKTFPEGYYNPRRDICSDSFVEEKNPLLMPNNMVPIRYQSIFGLRIKQ